MYCTVVMQGMGNGMSMAQSGKPTLHCHFHTPWHRYHLAIRPEPTCSDSLSKLISDNTRLYYPTATSRMYEAMELVMRPQYGTLATSQAAAQMFTQIMSDQSLFSTYISTFRRQIANSGVYCGSSLTAHAYECRIRASHRQSHMYSSNWGSDHPVLLRRNPGIVMCLNEMVALSAGYAQVTTWETCCRHCPCRRWDTGDGGSHS